MNIPPESNIPKEWLAPDIVQQLANMFYTGEPVESRPEREGDSSAPDIDAQELADQNEGADITLADFATPSLSEQHQTGRFYFLDDPQRTRERSTVNMTASKEPPATSFPVHIIRRDFPILHQRVHGKPLIWMDNAATTQKPRAVIDALSRFYERDNSNIHRGVHTLADRATEAYEQAREKVRAFIGAKDTQEIVFVRGTTEGINLVAQSYGRTFLRPGDEIVVTVMEHHANIVPWQMVCEATGAVLRVAPMNDAGEILLDEYAALLNSRTKLVAVTQVSNVLGTVNPVLAMTQMAHAVGARVLVDGAQSIPHMPVDVQVSNCDFFVFSGHKLFAPTGIGVLYGKAELLEMMPPWQGGGNMIQDVRFERTLYNSLPHKFEAGTGNIADAVGLGAAIDYLERIGFHAAIQHEEALLMYAIQALAEIPGLRLIGTAPHKVSVLSFVLNGIPNEIVGQRLNREGIAVRAGHHCAQPVLRRLGLESTVRPSLAFYNTFEEIDALTAAILKVKGKEDDSE